MELTSIARQLEAASDMIESLGMPILAAYGGNKGKRSFRGHPEPRQRLRPLHSQKVSGREGCYSPATVTICYGVTNYTLSIPNGK